MAPRAKGVTIRRAASRRLLWVRTVKRMGRARRIDVAGWHHVTCRAVDDVDVLARDTEKHIFARQLAIVVPRFDWSCLAFCLMSNHYHLLLRIPAETLTRGIHRLNSVFAHRYNEVHERRGHVFGERFASLPIASESHLFRTFRYVEMNPVAAGLVRSPRDWRWSSFRAIVGLAPPPPYLDLTAAHALFGQTLESARAEYEALVALPY